jgi:TonB-linked SusC/RagA family outer membrane protein
MVKFFTLIFSFFLLSSISAFAQEVKGRVVDENDEPIPGVSIIIEGTTTGVISDIDGIYSLKTTENNFVLLFSYIGFSDYSQEINLAEGEVKVINVGLKTETEMLEEYVVVGYGTAKKRDVAGSISSVSSDVIMAVPTPSFEASIQGQASGVSVTQGSGLAGSSSIIRIRGISSISAGGDPLYVVDGVPITQDQFITGNSGGMNNNPLAAINPSDIESIEILKDASATGIYGARGANGVVLITTKRAKVNGLKVDFSTRFAIAEPTAKPNMLNSQQYLQMYQEAWENDGNAGRAILPSGVSWEDAEKTNTNWVDETTQTGFKQFYSLGLNFKKNNFGTYANFTYDGNESYLKGNSYNRISGRINLDWAVSEKIKLAFSTSLSSADNNRVDAAWSGGLGSAMSTALPIYPVYYQEDVWEQDGNGDSTKIYSKGDFWDKGSNPVRDRETKTWINNELRSINNISVFVEPIKRFTIRFTGGYDYMRLNEQRFFPANKRDADSRNKADVNYHNINNYTLSIIPEYSWDRGEDNHFSVLGGWEYQYNINSGEFLELSDASGLIDNNVNRNDSNLRVDPHIIQEFAFMSYFARVNYNFKNKYYVQASGRIDGSSRFGKNNRYGFFPSASIGWIVSDEDFWKSKTFNYLKAKASWGITGNANMPNYERFGTYSPSNNVNVYAGNPTIYPIRIENPNLKWETTQNIDVGLEFGIFNNKITMEMAFYKKWASDVLLRVSVPQSTGFDTYWDNVAKIENSGLELSIGARIYDRENFTWKLNFNIARNFNEITSIGLYSPDAVSGGTNDTRVVVGEPVGTNFLVHFLGVDPENGKPIYQDINGNPTYTWDPKDRIAVGSVLPKAWGGITNNFRWKNWSASLLITYTLGANIYDSSSKRQLGVVTDWNMRTEIFDRWTESGQTNATYPRLTMDEANYGSSTVWINTDQWLKKGDYARFKNLTIAYTFPQVGKNELTFSNLRIAASMTNFLTFTNFEGLDPEIARDFEDAADRNLSQNITYLTPPQERTYSISLSFSF